MSYRVLEKNNKKYIEVVSMEKQISSEQEGLDLISLCFENDAYILILHADIFSEDFFNLRTRLAGAILQKFVNYNVKVALVLENEENLNDRFKEMISESNKGKYLRTFKNVKDAEYWILNL